MTSSAWPGPTGTRSPGRTAEYRAEFGQRTLEGASKWILSVGKVVKTDAQGQPLRMLGTHLDISDAKNAEAALLQLNEELGSRVEQRTAQVVQARDEAERANRAKSAFLSGMSHDLRTPMHAILGCSQLLQTEPAYAAPGKPQRYLQEFFRAGGHLLELIDDLRDLARIESGKQRINLEAVCVAVLVGECSSTTAKAATSRCRAALMATPCASPSPTPALA